MAAAFVVTALSWSHAPPALAHEFTVVMVSAGSAQSEGARRGFQVAVDASPDVSHPPGADAGDHLGGVDVDLVAVDDGERRSTADRVGDLLDGGAVAVVVLLVPSAAEAIGAAAAARDKLALVVSNSGASIAKRRALLLRPRASTDDEAAGVAAATTALRDALGDEPTRAVLLGYDAGRLLDTLTAQIGEDLQPSEQLTAAALAASANLASSRVIAAVDTAEAGEGAAGGTNGRGDRGAVLAAVALIAAGAVVLVKRRRPR